MKDFNGKVIVGTGGASGIGFAFCKRFLKEGVKVILRDINDNATTAKAKEISAMAIPANVGKEAEVKFQLKGTDFEKYLNTLKQQRKEAELIDWF